MFTVYSIALCWLNLGQRNSSFLTELCNCIAQVGYCDYVLCLSVCLSVTDNDRRQTDDLLWQ